MKNKQLDTKDLLMNKKEELIWRVIDNVISCCAVTRIDGGKVYYKRRCSRKIQRRKCCID